MLIANVIPITLISYNNDGDTKNDTDNVKNRQQKRCRQ